MNVGNVTLNNIVDFIIQPATLLVFSAGFLLFVWGLVVFIANPADSEKRETGKQHMLWGIIGMFIMVSVAGILIIIDDTFDLGIRDNQVGIPTESSFGNGPPPGFFDRRFDE